MANKLTSFDSGHRHTWNNDKKRTSIDFGHSHRVDLRKKLALPSGKDKHTHRLLKFIK